MTPQARLTAAIEVVDAIIDAARTNGPSGDAIISAYFKKRRYAGSKDRRAVRALVWDAVRRFGNRPHSARSAFVAMADVDPALGCLFTGEGHAPRPIEPNEERAVGGAIPDWIAPFWAEPDGGIDVDALLSRAPLDIRVNIGKTTRERVMSNWPDAQALPHAPNALRLPTGHSIDNSDEYRAGHFEIQDYGSQIIALACAVDPAMCVLDLCAGAGGKTLALAADMMNTGRLIAADTSRARLGELPKRAAKAGADIETRLLNGGQEREDLIDLQASCDVVLIDAPCSGTGTWRRNPETRWRLTRERLKQIVTTQSMLLDLAAELVRPGGAMVYAVCALTHDEGAGQISAFLSRNSSFVAEPIALEVGRNYGQGCLLTPCHDGCDGFYLARLKNIG